MHYRLVLCSSLLLLLTSPIAMGAPMVPVDQMGYQKTVAPFLMRHCNKCHSGSKPEGEFSIELSKLAIQFGDPSTRSQWREVVNVLNSHEMPPESEKQPAADEVASVVDWVTRQAVQAELILREQSIVLRRLNRAEYRNTIRDLIGIDFDPSSFPQDPPASGFDNNGGALTMSPLHAELYLAAAQQILDRALIEGDRPATIRWRFDPKAGPADRTRMRIDAKNNPLVNGGNNRQDGDWVVIHHNSWDKRVGARDFRVPTAGQYIIRVKAAGSRATRNEVVASARAILWKRKDDQDQKNPKGAKWTLEQFERDLEHFRSDRIYDYGPPRLKLNLQLGPLPKVLAEFDVDASIQEPQVYEFPARFTTESAGVSFEYAYDIPRVLENFWMQGSDLFARPEVRIDWFEVEGPIYDSWPPSSHTRILFPSSLQKTNETQYVREVLNRFMEKAYRRPVTTAEVAAKLELFREARAQKSFIEAIKLPLMSILSSPNFLYMVEPQPAGTVDRMNGDELAVRMSYFLWSSMPDERLFELAKTGQLTKPAIRQQEVDRLLADPKADAFVKNFAGQWLGLRDVGANPPAADLFPRYDRHLEMSMVGESEAYFREFLRNDLDVRQMLSSDFVTINERLARFYGIPDVRGDHFRRVQVDPSAHRGGLVTQASILTVTSNGTRTSPVKRGTWVLKTLLGIDPGLPVANAGEIAPKVPGIDKATVRQRLEIHRELPQCARCHSKIDPLGFALENYNASGEWRDREGFGYKGRIGSNDPLIDASSQMPDGTPIDGVGGLQSALLAKDRLFLTTISGRLWTYALGRELGLADQPVIQATVSTAGSEKPTLRNMIKAIVAHELFVAH